MEQRRIEPREGAVDPSPNRKPLGVDNGHAQPRKRRKIALACDQCRVRRTRCDGIRPVCGECSQRRNQSGSCRYKPTGQNVQGQEEYIEKLLERIRQLEQGRSGVPDEPIVELNWKDARFASLPVQSHRLVPMVDSIPNGQGGIEAPNNISSMSLPSPLERTSLGEGSPVDAMGADSATHPEGQTSDDRFYGSSSAVSFMQQVYNTIRQEKPFVRPQGADRSFPQQPQATKGRTFWTLRGMEHLSLFPRPLMDSVLDCYWERIYHLYPFIHRPTFMRAYNQLWESRPSEADLYVPGAGLGGSVEYGPKSIVFHCALNVMSALAVQFMDMPREERRRLEDVFAEKAKNLCQLDLLDDGSLAVIQTLLLMTQYLQSTPFPNRCWLCIGTSCRLAQSLGLHIESPQPAGRLGTLEIEMRRRVWYGCVTLDAVVSMTLGRPLMLHQQLQIPLPKAIDDEYLSDPQLQPVNHVSWVEFYVQSIKLYRLLSHTISQMYAPLVGTSAATSSNSDKPAGVGSFAFILETDAAISELEQQVPTHLDWERRESPPTHGEGTGVFAQQSSVLLVRFLHLRILLYRPAFTRYCQQICASRATRDGGKTGAPQMTEVTLAVARDLSMACVNLSIRLIEQINVRSTTVATGAWWYNLYYTRTAGIVILLAMVCDSVTASIGLATLSESWGKCEATLTALQTFNPAVAQCLRGLEKLHRHVLSYKQKNSLDYALHGLNGLHGFDNSTAASSFGPQAFDGDRDYYGGPTNHDMFGEHADFDWPNGVEASMLDDIFSLDLFNQ